MSNTVKLNTCPKCGAPIPVAAPQGLCPKCVLVGAATGTDAGVPATATSEIPSIERIATAFPQLEVLELIGRGGMGFVFKARQPHLDRFVALKLLPDKLAKDAQFAERFNREGRVLAKLNHPSIVSVFDFGQTGGFYYLLMEYVDGVNLRQAMRAGRFSPAEALSVVPKVCEALQYAHEQGVLHRDIKPENILLDTKGRVKIADFGIAKLVGEDQPGVTLTNTGAALGTLHYMAPEQLEKPSSVDHRADIYSLGVVFYEMLTGELPIGRFAAPSTKTPVGTNVDDVVFRTLEKEPGKRFQSAGEVQTRVQDLANEARATTGRVQAGGAGEGRGELGPHGTVVIGDPKRVLSRWSIYGAISVALSLPAPLKTLFSMLTGGMGMEAKTMWLSLASVAMLGLGGTLLGWLGLNEIRESGGRVRGLPLAMFATLLWPLALFGALTIGLPMFWIVPDDEPSFARTVGRFLVLVLPAAVIAFGFWSIHATALWAGRNPVPQRSGVLKWIFIGVLVVGMGVVMQFSPKREVRRPAPIVTQSSARSVTTEPEASPMIQFTFTSVELREDGGRRWLVMDYDEQVHGDCQHTFRYDARVPGFTAQTRMDSSLSDARAGFAPVLHQRVSWKLPDSLPEENVLALRNLVAKEWVGKSVAIAPGDERVLFKVLVPNGGTLVTAVGVKGRNAEKRAAQESAIGSAKLIGATAYHQVAIARIESVPGHPLHQMIARFAGPEISEQVLLARSGVTGPLLIPSPDEDVNRPAEAAEGSVLWGTNQAPMASAVSFECPGDYSIQFVLPDEAMAREAVRQMEQALARPVSLVPGRPVPLFATGNWKGWLETRPFKPSPNRLVFFRHPGRSPAHIPGTNLIESAVATIPQDHELTLTSRVWVDGVPLVEPAFHTTLRSGPGEPGVYWFTWYALPNPQNIDDGDKETWELQIHDAAGRELLRSEAPESLKTGWRRRWVGEPFSLPAGNTRTPILFEKSPRPGDRAPGYVYLEMTMQPTP